jgi:RND superfamily putative drug exporter
VFAFLGRAIGRHPALIIGAWVILLAAVVIGQRLSFLGRTRPLGAGAVLPPNSDYIRATNLYQQAFPQLGAESQIAVVAVRPSGIKPADLQWLGRLASAARQATDGHVLSPASPLLRWRLLSPDGQAAMLIVNLQTSFVSPQTVEAVNRVTSLAHVDVPAGLQVQLTGTAAMGRDYTLASQTGARRTTWVTILAVLAILIVVYRSPVGALVPLISIGASAYMAYLVLELSTLIGWQFAATEWVFCVVLIFGAGTDYALFWIARYREALGTTTDLRSAALTAMTTTGPAILAGAAVTICGLSTMLAAELVPTHNAGRVLAAALAINLLACLTLTPALARSLGRWLFWPADPAAPPGLGARHWWPWLARRVTDRPWPVLLAGTAALAVAAALSLRLEPVFRGVFDLPPDTPSRRGLRLAEEHFSKGQLYAATLLIEFPPGSQPDFEALSARITAAVQREPGVAEVHSLTMPLAVGEKLPPFAEPLARPYYVSETPDGAPVMRFEILLNDAPFTPQALTAVERAQGVARQASIELMPAQAAAPRVMLAGPSAYILSERTIANADQQRVVVLAAAVIAVIVLLLVRNVPLTAFMVLTTLLTYGATLTLSRLFFVHVMGLPGIDWKVRLILFVIVMAVGQDYNIFLVTRLREETRRGNRLQAVREAVIRTGPVISSCGIIMAATLGSLCAGRLSLLRQLGFALALGVLIDTFFVRPLLIPAFFLIISRKPKTPNCCPAEPGRVANSHQ